MNEINSNINDVTKRSWNWDKLRQRAANRKSERVKCEIIETAVVFLDVDAPQDLAASNIQTENGMLTWKPPRADITGYILSFESADGTVRVSRHQSSTDAALTDQ